MAIQRSFLGKSRKVYLKLMVSMLSLLGLATSTAFVIHLVHGDLASRSPASVITNEDGDPVFWEESIDDLNRDAGLMRGVKLKAIDTSQIFASIAAEKEKVSPDEATRRTGVKSLRARRALFVPESLYAGVRSRGRVTVLNLFTDTKLRVLMNAPSAYRTNAGVYTGTLADDPTSKVHLYVEDDHVNGFIETAKGRFRILDSGLGDSYIIEEKPDRVIVR